MSHAPASGAVAPGGCPFARPVNASANTLSLCRSGFLQAWPRLPEVLKTALLYGAVGAFHYIFRRKFLAISIDHRRAEAEGMSVRF